MEINLHMLRALMLNWIWRQVDSTHIVAIDKGAAGEMLMEFMKKLTDPTSFGDAISDGPVLSLSTWTRHYSGAWTIKKRDCHLGRQCSWSLTCEYLGSQPNQDLSIPPVWRGCSDEGGRGPRFRAGSARCASQQTSGAPECRAYADTPTECHRLCQAEWKSHTARLQWGCNTELHLKLAVQHLRTPWHECRQVCCMAWHLITRHVGGHQECTAVKTWIIHHGDAEQKSPKSDEEGPRASWRTPAAEHQWSDGVEGCWSQSAQYHQHIATSKLCPVRTCRPRGMYQTEPQWNPETINAMQTDCTMPGVPASIHRGTCWVGRRTLGAEDWRSQRAESSI